TALRSRSEGGADPQALHPGRSQDDRRPAPAALTPRRFRLPRSVGCALGLCGRAHASHAALGVRHRSGAGKEWRGTEPAPTVGVWHPCPLREGPILYRDMAETRRRQIRYGALAVAVVILAAGLILLADRVAPTPASVPAEGTRRAANGG